MAESHRGAVAIVVTTYFPPGDDGHQRVYATLEAIKSWNTNLDADTSLPWVIVDDGSPIEHLEEFAYHMMGVVPWHSLCTDRLGCGGALNAGVRYVLDNDLADVIFFAQDDWMLTEPLDLAPSLALLSESYVVRLGPTHPNLAGHVVRTAIPGAEWCLEYDWSGGGYVTAWRPSLYRAEVLRDSLAGLEGLACIEAERVWLERMAQARPRVFHAPNCTLAGPFRHIETTELGEDSPATLTERYAP